MGNFWTIFEIKICLRARKVILPGLLRNGLPDLFTMPLIIITEVLRSLFVLKFIVSPCVFCCCCCFVFLSSTELHEVNNYDTNLSTEANASTPRYGPVPYFVVIGTNQHGIASGEKSFFFFAKRRATVLPIYFHFLWATDVTNIIGMRN